LKSMSAPRFSSLPFLLPASHIGPWRIWCAVKIVKIGDAVVGPAQRSCSHPALVLDRGDCPAFFFRSSRRLAHSGITPFAGASTKTNRFFFKLSWVQGRCRPAFRHKSGTTVGCPCSFPAVGQRPGRTQRPVAVFSSASASGRPGARLTVNPSTMARRRHPASASPCCSRGKTLPTDCFVPPRPHWLTVVVLPGQPRHPCRGKSLSIAPRDLRAFLDFMVSSQPSLTHRVLPPGALCSESLPEWCSRGPSANRCPAQGQLQLLLPSFVSGKRWLTNVWKTDK